MKGQDQKVKSNLDKLDEKVNSNLDKLKTEVNSNLNELNSKLNKLDQKVQHTLTTRLSRLEESMAYLVQCQQARQRREKEEEEEARRQAVIGANCRQQYGSLNLAVEKEDVEAVQWYLNNGGNVGAVDDYYKMNSLHWAALCTKNTDVLTLLLNHSTCNNNVINAKSSGGYTPLKYATNCNSSIKNALVELLKQHGAQ
ncbi:MAG: hypothetical protein CMO44_17310 [Verrucomicrobiales bacterium]|nr:hypothetical protein [Verrucomicrobiales bacterium]